MASKSSQSPRVGIPYRTRKEELTGEREKYERYCEGVQRAGGEPVEISLALSPAQLKETVFSLDALVLPGSPADVDPSRFGAVRHPGCGESDPNREQTDFALLKLAFAEHKPVLAICFGVQSLNVFLGGSLIQDIPSEIPSQIQHKWDTGMPEPFHLVQIEPGARLAQMAGANEVRVNSSHHQSVLKPGRDLRVAAYAPDGVIEAVEWTGDSNWVTGVQWHPERTVAADSLSQSLFSELVKAARKAPVHS
ncbi:MAG: gamma-glutamyl-gamma-aminobutyrate hydrolase family protein [Candidatus Acidiferrales bacterium]|jgi:putative glutamine amidotransferase